MHYELRDIYLFFPVSFLQSFLYKFLLILWLVIMLLSQNVNE